MTGALDHRWLPVLLPIWAVPLATPGLDALAVAQTVTAEACCANFGAVLALREAR